MTVKNLALPVGHPWICRCPACGLLQTSCNRICQDERCKRVLVEVTAPRSSRVSVATSTALALIERSRQARERVRARTAT